MSAIRTARDVLWLSMVERAEALHDAVVLGQRDTRTTSARNIEGAATDLAALARAATLMRSKQQ